MTGVQLAEFSTLPQSIVREAREISTELTRQKEVDMKLQFVFQSPHFISIYQSFRKNETGGFSLAQSQIMSEELTLLHLSRVSAAYPPVYVLLLPNLMNPWLRALISFDVWRLFS